MGTQRPEFPEKLFNISSFSFSSKNFKWENVMKVVNVGMCWVCYFVTVGVGIPMTEKLCREVYGTEARYPWAMRVLIAVENNTLPLMMVITIVSLAALFQMHRSYARFREAGFPENHWIYRMETSKLTPHIFWGTLIAPLMFAMAAFAQVTYEIYRMSGPLR